MLTQPIAVICLSPYNGGMEMLAISFAKKLQNNLKDIKIISIVKENSLMHKTLQDENE